MKYIYLIVPLLCIILTGCGETHRGEGIAEVMYVPSYLEFKDGLVRFNKDKNSNNHEFGFKTKINGIYITEVDLLSSNDVLFIYTNYPDLKFPVNIKITDSGVSDYNVEYFIGERDIIWNRISHGEYKQYKAAMAVSSPNVNNQHVNNKVPKVKAQPKIIGGGID